MGVAVAVACVDVRGLCFGSSSSVEAWASAKTDSRDLDAKTRDQRARDAAQADIGLFDVAKDLTLRP